MTKIIKLIIIIGTSFLLLSIMIGTLFTGITPTPTLPLAKRRILQIAQPLSATSIAELGAGFGTMAFAFAQKFPQAEVVAYETSWVPWMILHLRKKVQPRRNLTIIRKNFYKQDLNQFDLLYTYLYPKAMHRLKQKLEDQPAHRSLISNSFAMNGWVPDIVDKQSGRFTYTVIYLYSRNPS